MKEFNITVDETIESISQIIEEGNLPAEEYVSLVSAYADLLKIRNNMQFKTQKEEISEIKRQIEELKNELLICPCNCCYKHNSMYQYGGYGGGGNNV